MCDDARIVNSIAHILKYWFCHSRGLLRAERPNLSKYEHMWNNHRDVEF